MHYRASSWRSRTGCDGCGAYRRKEEHYDEGIVYFGYASQFAAADVLPCQFIAAGDRKFPDGEVMCCAARTKESDLFLAFNLSHKLIDLSTGRGLYDELIAIADQKEILPRS